MLRTVPVADPIQVGERLLWTMQRSNILPKLFLIPEFSFQLHTCVPNSREVLALGNGPASLHTSQSQ